MLNQSALAERCPLDSTHRGFALPYIRARHLPVVLLLLAACHNDVRPERQLTGAARYAADVAFLAADEQEGRGVATEGIRRAAAYIARQLNAFGLEPAFDESYYQPFTAMVGAYAGGRSFLSIGGRSIPSTQYGIFGISSSGTFGAQVAFAGYGITAPEFEYDDYAGIDVRGKAVLILRYEPQITDSASKFNGNQWSEYATFRYKIFNARRHGAAAVILVTGPKDTGDKGDELVPMQSDPMAGLGFGIPMFHVARSAIEPLLKTAGVDLFAVQAAIDADLLPRSRLLDAWASGWADLQRKSFFVSNVGAVITGRDASQTLVIGAHYDHLGFGGPYRESGEPDLIYHGADDNASGVAGLLALARWYSAGPPPPTNILFLAFTAEESGLVGSTYFVQHPPGNLGRMRAMLNLDMIGRLRNNTVTLFGTGSALEFPALIGSDAAQGLSVVFKPEGFGPSDHAPFYGSGIPVLHVFTGTHDQYHKVSDTPETVNVEGALQVVELTRRIADRVMQAPSLAYVPPADQSVGILMAQGAGPNAPYLGVVPSFASSATGAVVAAVRPASPAEGVLLPGDQIVGFGGEPVVNYYELTYLLRKREPDETVEMLVKRDGLLRRHSVRLGRWVAAD